MKKIAAGVLLGASLLALAGCEDQQRFGPAGPFSNDKGVGELYGCDPMGSVKDCIPNDTPSFPAEVFSVIYMEFQNGNGHGFNSRQVYFKQKNNPDLDPSSKELKCAIDYVKNQSNQTRYCTPIKTQAKNDPHPFAKHRGEPNSRPGSTRGRGPYKTVRNNFDGTLFGSPQRVYVVLGNNDVKFNSIIPISFTPFGAYDFEVGIGTTRKKNTTIFNAKVYAKNTGPFNDSGYGGLYFRNYFLDEAGSHMKKNKFTELSMNINLLLCTQINNCSLDSDTDKEPGNIIPIAIDPDTGNGWGSKP